ncbi:hypothetical protein HJG60_010748 [Phyllostomus discolor]|uniref:Uncharacterized protein n=1 Tax=Phyllostomus discolor TaxID=89673 RepID=A0A834A7G5_9CHIR|nr:hypothetical protein HJG60_010748 [Phyllostomus discolor]
MLVTPGDRGLEATRGHRWGHSEREEPATPRSPGAPVPPAGLSLKPEEKSLAAGTGPGMEETRVSSALCADTVFKENSSGDAWQIMDERPGRARAPGDRPGRLCSPHPLPGPAGPGTLPETEAGALAPRLVFNI